jgi:uncharacterized damage-inducible protein DinB
MDPMAKALWLGLERSDMFIETFTSRLSGDDWTALPPDLPNCALWTLGHLAYHRGLFLYLLNGQRTWDERWPALFGLGCPPAECDQLPGVDECRAVLAERRQDLTAWLEKATTAMLKSPPVESSRFFATKAEVLVHLSHHEAHHTECLSMASRLLGRDKVI